MLRQKLAALVVTAGLVVLAVMVWPLAFGSGAFCGQGASAQENPCAAQEATIAALEATIAALQGQPVPATTPPPVVSAATPVPAPVSGTPVLTDGFDNNARGWYLIPNDNTSANVAGGQLVFSADPAWFRWATIPELTVTNFYIQAQVATPDVRHALVGFAVGNGQTSQYHFFVAGEDGTGANIDWVARVYEWSGSGDLTRAFSTSFGAAPLWGDGETVTLGLAAQDGTYTLYLNGAALASAQFTAYGHQLGLFFYTSVRGTAAATAYFDNLSVSLP